jgi:hypothetical protein
MSYKITQISFFLCGGRAISEAVSRRHLAGKPGSTLCQSMWDLWWTVGHCDKFLPTNLSFPVGIIPPVLPSSRHPDSRLTGKINGLSMRTLRKQRSFAYRGTLDTKVLCLLSVFKGRQVSMGQVFFRVLHSSPVSIILSTLHDHLNLNKLLSGGPAGEPWKPSNKAVLLWILESTGQKSTFTKRFLLQTVNCFTVPLQVTRIYSNFFHLLILFPEEIYFHESWVFNLISFKARVDFHNTWYEQDTTGEIISTSSYKSQSQTARLER